MKKVPKMIFLKDVFLCSLGAFGGPESHMSVFLDQLVRKKKYLTEEDLIELIALCSILPGPTSTQTITSVGYRTGGPVLASLTMLVWALPILLFMGALSFAYALASRLSFLQDTLRYIGPMAAGFVVVAALRIGRKVVKDRFTAMILLFSGAVSYFFHQPWVFPLLLAGGGTAEIIRRRRAGGMDGPPLQGPLNLKPRWIYLALFFGLIAASLAARAVWAHPLAVLFESFYRYGYLVFGGGQVVVPMMFSELVEINRYMSAPEFLAGYGLVQGMPGPMFSFAAFAGGMAARGAGTAVQLAGAVLGGVGIFLPGLLLIFFVYPLWEDIKKIPLIRVSLSGINAAAGGLLAAAAPRLFIAAGLSPVNVAAAGLTAVLLGLVKVPAPLVVAAALGAGAVTAFFTG
jgi:chromate transporter